MVQELPEGTVTVLFTDVVGSTELTNRLGDERAREVLGSCDELVRGQIERHRGREVKGTGDGLMVAFTSARRAVSCAIDIQRALAAHNSHGGDAVIAVRIGLNTGEVVREEEDLFGATVNAAARIAAEGEAGDILVSEGVKIVLGTATTAELEDQGETELKGFHEPWRLYSVKWQEAAGPAAALGSGRTPYVGREPERAQLRQFLEQAENGQGSLVMIGGEPGVGKTRIAEELLAEAEAKGFLALVGHCYEMEGAPPYIPFVEILETTARIVPPEALREALGDAAPEVAKLMPELRRMFPDIPAAVELPPEQERHYLFNNMREFIERAGRAQPLLLVLEDLHWGDDSTLLLLQHIAQQLGEMPVLVVGTYRDVELDVARPLAKALDELLRQRLAHRLSLRRLPEAAVEGMLRAMSGQEPPRALGDVIYGETEGLPFFVEEVFRHLVEEGKLFDDSGHWLSDLKVGELDVPEGVRLAVGRRLERIDSKTRNVLTSAAVVGRNFTFELLEALAEEDTDTLLDAMDEAERSLLIVPALEGREERFSFAHELLRQTLLAGISSPRRRRLHLRVAETMEQVYADTLEEHAADLAYHFDQAGAVGDAKKMVRYLTLAGNRALGAAGFEEALRHFEGALSLMSGEDQKERADLLYKRGSALRSLGRWDEAIADWREALSDYEEADDTEAVGRICWQMTYQLLWVADFAQALETANRGLTAIADRISVDRCRLLASVGLSRSISGEYAAGDSLIAQAMAMAQELGNVGLLGLLLNYKAAHHWYYAQTHEQVEAGLRAVELLRSASDLWELANALWYTQYALMSLGRFEEAAEIGEEVEPLATRLGNLGALLCARRGTGCLEVMTTGDIDRFDEFAKEDMELCRSTGSPWISNSYTYLGLADFWRGRWEEALESFQEGARLEPPGFLAGMDWASLFLGKAYAGDKDSALAMLDHDRSKSPRPGQPKTVGTLSILVGQVEGLAVLGERQEAAKLHRAILESMDMGNPVMWPGRLLQTVAGIAAACGEQWEKAEEHYQTALRQAHELPVVIEQPEVRRWYARMLLDRAQTGTRPGDGPGDPSTGSGRDRDKARELLTEAVAMYTKFGMPKHVEMAETMIEES